MLETYGLHELVWDACDERFGDMLVASPADAGGRGISLAVRDGGAAADLTGATITITDKNGTTTADIAKGAPGEKGDTGATGPQGPQGEQGPKGETGATGATGPQGPRGETGPSGQDGADGVSCTHSWNGTVLSVTSASGTSSADLVGPQGPTGATGPSGADGTVFTPASPLSLANGELSIDLSDYPTSEDLPKDFFGYYNFPRAKDSGGSTWVRLGYNNYWGNAKVGDLVFNNRFLTLASITRITKGYVDGAMPDLTGYATQTWVNSQITAAIAALDDLSEEEF